MHGQAPHLHFHVHCESKDEAVDISLMAREETIQSLKSNLSKA